MYDELIKRLRNAAQWADKGLVITPSVLLEAADALEELSRAQEQWIEQERNALLKSIPRWIPVTERLPEPNTRVIGFMAWKGITAIEYQHGNWYSIDHLQPLPDEAVTHWMPLPEPPRDDKDINVLGKEEGET